MEKSWELFPVEAQHEMKMQLKYLCSETIDHLKKVFEFYKSFEKLYFKHNSKLAL